VADTKISALTAASVALAADEFAVNEAGTSKKLTLTQIITLLQASYGLPRVKGLAADHAISSTTATEVTGLGPVTLEAGTYVYLFELIVQSATTTVGIGLGVNFTGTAAVRTIYMRYPSTGTTAITGVMDDVGAGTGQTVEHNVQTAFSTTAPNMVNTAGFATANAPVPVIIEGILVVTASGDLELWHSSETATSTTVKAGSSLVVCRTA
jgi:hypothetical protein